MEISKREDSVRLTEQTYAAAAKGTPVLQMQNVGMELGKLIADCYLTKGQTISPTDLQIQAQKLYDEIRLVFPAVTHEELKLAFFHGVRGAFGEYIGLNLVTYQQWIKSVLNDEKRGRAIYAEKAAQIPESKIPTDEEQEQMFLEIVKTGFERFLSDGKIRDYGNLIYHYLDRLGKLEIPAEKKWQFMESAKDEMIREARNQSLDPAEKFGKKIDAQNLIDRIEQNRQTQNDKTAQIIRAKNIAINWWFHQLKDQNKKPI